MKPTPEQFLKDFPDTAKFLDKIKARAPVKIENLKRLVTYHKDPELCERYMWSMLQNLSDFKLIKMSSGIVIIP